MSDNYSKGQKKTILSLSVITVALSFFWFAKENWELEKHFVSLQGWPWFVRLNVEPLVTFFASAIPVATLYWPFKARYTSTRLKDSIVIDMHNSKRIEIGKDKYKFIAHLGTNSPTSAHLMVRFDSNTELSGVANDVGFFNEVKDVTKYRLTNEDKSPDRDDVIILQNRYGRYALLKITEISSSTGNTQGQIIKVDYVINSEHAINFS
ncbi:hypothetical protein ACWXV6_22175 [Pantoea ananatis]